MEDGGPFIGQGGGSLTDAFLLPIYSHSHVRRCSKRRLFYCHAQQVPNLGRQFRYFPVIGVALAEKGASDRVQGIRIVEGPARRKLIG
jgi:hypothetical protein